MLMPCHNSRTFLSQPRKIKDAAMLGLSVPIDVLLGLSGNTGAGAGSDSDSDADAANTNADVDMCHEYSSRHDRDDILFAQPEGSCYGDCPICFLPMPFDLSKHVVLTSCCSKYICKGCIHVYKKGLLSLQRPCPFCRHPMPTTQAEADANHMRRAAANDPTALLEKGKIHNRKGEYTKAIHYWSKAAALGDALAHCHLSVMYCVGEGFKKDEIKFIHHSEDAAIAGHPSARYNLGAIEWKKDNFERAVKHFIIAANLGEDKSLKMLKEGYVKGYVSKDDYAAALRAHQAAIDAMKSPQREAAMQS